MHHFSGLGAPFVRSKGTVSGGVFIEPDNYKISCLSTVRRDVMLLASARLRRAVLPTLGWGKQSTWLAASGSLAHLQARPAPTPGREVDTTGRPLSRPCRPCVPLSGRGRVNTQGSPISGGVFSTCGRCFLKSRQAECSHENSEKERLRGSPVSGPLGAFDFRTRIKDRRR